MGYDSEIGKGGYWSEGIQPMNYGQQTQPGFDRLYGAPPQVVFVSGMEGGGHRRRSMGRGKKVAYGLLAVTAGLGIWQHKTIEDKVDTFIDNRHEKCMPSSAKMKDQTFEVCFKPSSLYDRGDGTVGALATLKAIEAETFTPDTATAGTTDPNVAPVEKTAPHFYEIVGSLCSIGTDKGAAELTNVRKFIIDNTNDLSRKVKHIPTDPALIIITSEFQGQQPGQSPAIVSCP